MNRKGQVGLETVKMVMLALLVLGILAFTFIVVIGQLNSSETAQKSGSGGATNETVTIVDSDGDNLALNTRPDCSASVSEVVNVSGLEIGSGNYTISGCTITANDGSEFNNTDWNVTYTGTYNQFGNINANLSNATESFFSNAGTWFALLAIVVIILIVAIVIVAVNRFGNSREL